MSLASPVSANGTFELAPYDQYDSYYTEAVRRTLASFHINLSKGDYAANAPLNAPDIHWNYDGRLVIGRDNFVTALQTTAESFSKGLQARDYYQVVDGHVGATLFALYGTQTGPVGDVPVTPGARFNTITGEVFVFNEHAENRELWTIDQLGRIAQQVSGQATVPSIESIPPLLANPHTPPEYRAGLRQKMAALHANVNAGKPEDNAAIALDSVVVDENGNTTEGKTAFVDLLASRNAGLGAFPRKIFHDDHILADGKLGVISAVWQAPQESAYNGVEAAEGAQARMREMLWFEFDEDGMVTKVTAVYEESVVGPQLKSGSLYP